MGEEAARAQARAQGRDSPDTAGSQQIRVLLQISSVATEIHQCPARMLTWGFFSPTGYSSSQQNPGLQGGGCIWGLCWEEERVRDAVWLLSVRFQILIGAWVIFCSYIQPKSLFEAGCLLLYKAEHQPNLSKILPLLRDFSSKEGKTASKKDEKESVTITFFLLQII